MARAINVSGHLPGWLIVGTAPLAAMLTSYFAFVFRNIANQIRRMIQKTFSIYADDLSGCRLFIEAGSQHIAAWFTETVTGSLKAFEFFQFDNGHDTVIDEIARQVKLQSRLMSMQMDAALIIWENPACTCVPEEFFKNELADSYLNIIAGEAEGATRVEENFGRYVLLSRHPTAYADAIKKHLATGPSTHKFSFLLKKYAPANGEKIDLVRAVFYPEKLIIIAFKQNELQLIQSIQYSTAEDVLYLIMKISGDYGLDLSTIPVVLSGLINAGSVLFDTLYKYIEHVEIEKSPENTFNAPGFAEHPAQYFLPFIQ